jgi:hypothetical protein
MDVVDRAQQVEALNTELAIESVRRCVQAVTPEGTGRCWGCGDALARPLRFCSPPCRDEYDTKQRRGKR